MSDTLVCDFDRYLRDGARNSLLQRHFGAGVRGGANFSRDRKSQAFLEVGATRGSAKISPKMEMPRLSRGALFYGGKCITFLNFVKRNLQNFFTFS
jgi:hypothetical protein